MIRCNAFQSSLLPRFRRRKLPRYRSCSIKEQCFELPARRFSSAAAQVPAADSPALHSHNPARSFESVLPGHRKLPPPIPVSSECHPNAPAGNFHSLLRLALPPEDVLHQIPYNRCPENADPAVPPTRSHMPCHPPAHCRCPGGSAPRSAWPPQTWCGRPEPPPRQFGSKTGNKETSREGRTPSRLAFYFPARAWPIRAFSSGPSCPLYSSWASVPCQYSRYWSLGCPFQNSW